MQTLREYLLKYLIEEPHISRSGHWWRVLVPANEVANINASNAKAFIDNQTEGFAGGSYFESTGFKYSMNQAYFDKLISEKTHYTSDTKAIKCILQSNIKNSVWVRTTLDQSLIGDGWVNNYFQYSNLETEPFNRSMVQALDQNQAYFAKEIAISEDYIPNFLAVMNAIGIKEFVLLETFDSDTASEKSLYLSTLYIKPSDFEQYFKPNLKELRAVDLRDINLMNDPDRIIWLEDYVIKYSDLMKYWEIVGADTDEKRAWNTPTYEKLKSFLAEHGFYLS